MSRRRSFTAGLFIGIVSMRLYETLPPRPLPMPGDEAAFVRAVTAARLAYIGAPNDLARLPLRDARAAAICAALPGLAFSNWTGRLTAADANTLPDLLGQTTVHLAITIAPHIVLETAGSPLMNLPGGMLVVGSPVANAAAAIRLHQPVMVSGRLPGSAADCATETSLTLGHAMSDPTFKLVLTALGPLR
jgi:hypothetical protein